MIIDSYIFSNGDIHAYIFQDIISLQMSDI